MISRGSPESSRRDHKGNAHRFIHGFARESVLRRKQRQKRYFQETHHHPKRACPTNGSDRGSLRSHDLTLFVIPFKSFLSDDNDKLKDPFSDREYTYYTDGFIIIRANLNVTVTKAPPFNNITLPWPSLFTGELHNIKKQRVGKKKCKNCHGTGEVVTCCDCDGTGYVTWEVGDHEYEADCLECEGSGNISSGSGEECPECGGDGFFDNIEPVVISGRVALSNVALNKLSILPNCKVSHIAQDNCFYFIFDGGDGLAMGMMVGV